MSILRSHSFCRYLLAGCMLGCHVSDSVTAQAHCERHIHDPCTSGFGKLDAYMA